MNVKQFCESANGNPMFKKEARGGLKIEITPELLKEMGFVKKDYNEAEDLRCLYYKIKNKRITDAYEEIKTQRTALLDDYEKPFREELERVDEKSIDEEFLNTAAFLVGEKRFQEFIKELREKFLDKKTGLFKDGFYNFLLEEDNIGVSFDTLRTNVLGKIPEKIRYKIATGSEPKTKLHKTIIEQAMFLNEKSKELGLSIIEMDFPANSDVPNFKFEENYPSIFYLNTPAMIKHIEMICFEFDLRPDIYGDFIFYLATKNRIVLNVKEIPCYRIIIKGFLEMPEIMLYPCKKGGILKSLAIKKDIINFFVSEKYAIYKFKISQNLVRDLYISDVYESVKRKTKEALKFIEEEGKISKREIGTSIPNKKKFKKNIKVIAGRMKKRNKTFEKPRNETVTDT